MPYVFWQVHTLDLTSTCAHNYFSLFYWFQENWEVSVFSALRWNRLTQFVPKNCAISMRLLFNYVKTKSQHRKLKIIPVSGLSPNLPHQPYFALFHSCILGFNKWNYPGVPGKSMHANPRLLRCPVLEHFSFSLHISF